MIEVAAVAAVVVKLEHLGRPEVSASVYQKVGRSTCRHRGRGAGWGGSGGGGGGGSALCPG